MKKESSNILEERYRRLLLLIQDNWLRFIIATVMMVIIAGTTSVTALLVKPVMDDIFIKKDLAKLIFIPLVMMALYFIRGGASFGHAYLMNYIGQSIVRRLRNRLYDRITDLSIAFFHKEKTGVLMSRVTNDVNIVRAMVSQVVTRTVRDFLTILGLIIVIFYRDWQMALIAIVILPAFFFPIFIFGKMVRKSSIKVQEAMANLSAFLHETFAGNKIVKAFGMERYEKERFHEKTAHLFKKEMKVVVAKELSSPFMEIVTGIGIAFVIWFGGTRVINGVTTVGTFFSFMTAAFMLYEPVRKLNKLNNMIQEGLAATDRVFDIIELEPDIREDKDAVDINTGSHIIRFKDVSFKYDEEMVLNHINLQVRPGEVLALAGMSGGGKSSLVNLIPRFYDVSGGGITIDDIDLKKATLSSLRNQIAIVTQEPILFNDSVRNNIAYGNRNASDEDIIDAAKAAYAFDFIQGFPEKFQTNIGELGSRLSGGEKQRICIARALLKNAPILILDEATSSLDAESEMLVQKALENLMKGRTTFVIAHRLSTIGYADRIIVIVDGNIVEEGKHEDLIAGQGEYYKLHQMQTGNEDTH